MEAQRKVEWAKANAWSRYCFESVMVELTGITGLEEFCIVRGLQVDLSVSEDIG